MTKVAIILTQGFSDWEYALIAGLGRPFYGLDCRFFTPRPGEVLSMGGLAAMIDQPLEAISQWRPQAIAVIGGTIWESPDAPDIGELVCSHHAAGGVVAGICGGTLALARSGLLNTRPHTSNDRAFLIDNAGSYSGADYYRDCPAAVAADRVITAPGSAPGTFTAAVFESVGVPMDAVAQLRSMMAAEHA